MRRRFADDEFCWTRPLNIVIEEEVVQSLAVDKSNNRWEAPA